MTRIRSDSGNGSGSKRAESMTLKMAALAAMQSVSVAMVVIEKPLFFHSTRSPLRQGFYRALAATANHFDRESFMDELAHLVNVDPLEFRLKNMKNDRL